MDKEWTTQEGQVTYLIRITRRPGYLPALAHLIKKCALRFYLCHWYKQSIPRSKAAYNPYFLCWHQEPSAVVLEGLRTENTAIYFQSGGKSCFCAVKCRCFSVWQMECFRTYRKSIKIFSDFFEKRLAYSEKML